MASSRKPRKATPRKREQWEAGFEQLADAQNLFQAANQLALDMYAHTDHNGTPTLIALQAVAEKGTRNLTETWSTFEAIKNGAPQKAKDEVTA